MHGLSLSTFNPVIPSEKKSEWIGKMTMLTVASIRGRTLAQKRKRISIYHAFRMQKISSRDPCLRDQLGHVSRIFHTRACYAAAQS